MSRSEAVENASMQRDTPSSPKDAAEALMRSLGVAPVWPQLDGVIQAIHERDRLIRAEEREAYGYLRRVFEICAPQCEPLPNLLGLCTQIDNLIAGYRIALKKLGESEERTTDE